VVRLFPASKCVPVQGKLSHDPGYCSNEASFVKLGIEPARGKRKDVGDVVRCKKRRRISTQGLEIQREHDRPNQGLERKPETAQGWPNDLQREQEKERVLDDLRKQLETLEDLQRKHDQSNREKERILDDLKQQLETSRKETLIVTNDLSSELDVAARVFISHIRNNFNQVPKDFRGTLEEVYRLQPPLCERHKLLPLTERDKALLGEIRGNESFGSLMKAFKLARMHFHPDKNVNGGAWCKVVCLHISQLFANIHDYIYGGDYSRPMA
jgi:hypothetical protein